MVLDLTIAMTACLRQAIPLSTVIGNVRAAGFSETIHVFCEPDLKDQVSELPGVVHYFNSSKLGGWNNWRQAALALTAADTKHVMLLEDDIEFAVSTRALLEQFIQEQPNFSLISLYFSRRDQRVVNQITPGWFRHNRGLAHLGNLALVFNNNGALRKYLEYSIPVHKIGNTYPHYDRILFNWYSQQQEHSNGVWTHYPSLTEHLGGASTQGHVTGTAFLGADYDRNYDGH